MATIYVPDDYPTIRAAWTAASNGDVIEITSPAHTEGGIILTNTVTPLTIRSGAPDGRTTLRWTVGTCITVNGTITLNIEGIDFYAPTSAARGINISTTNTELHLENCSFTNVYNTVNPTINTASTIYRCLFTNTAYIQASNVTLYACVFHRASASGAQKIICANMHACTVRDIAATSGYVIASATGSIESSLFFNCTDGGMDITAAPAYGSNSYINCGAAADDIATGSPAPNIEANQPDPMPNHLVENFGYSNSQASASLGTGADLGDGIDFTGRVFQVTPSCVGAVDTAHAASIGTITDLWTIPYTLNKSLSANDLNTPMNFVVSTSINSNIKAIISITETTITLQDPLEAGDLHYLTIRLPGYATNSLGFSPDAALATQLPSDVEKGPLLGLTHAIGYQLTKMAGQVSTKLIAPITATSFQALVESTSLFPPNGTVWVGGHQVTYDQKTDHALTGLTFINPPYHTIAEGTLVYVDFRRSVLDADTPGGTLPLLHECADALVATKTFSEYLDELSAAHGVPRLATASADDWRKAMSLVVHGPRGRRSTTYNFIELALRHLATAITITTDAEGKYVTANATIDPSAAGRLIRIDDLGLFRISSVNGDIINITQFGTGLWNAPNWSTIAVHKAWILAHLTTEPQPGPVELMLGSLGDGRYSPAFRQPAYPGLPCTVEIIFFDGLTGAPPHYMIGDTETFPSDAAARSGTYPSPPGGHMQEDAFTETTPGDGTSPTPPYLLGENEAQFLEDMADALLPAGVGITGYLIRTP